MSEEYPGNEEFERRMREEGITPKDEEPKGDEFTQYLETLAPAERNAIIDNMQRYIDGANQYREQVLRTSANAKLSDMLGEDIEIFVKQFGHRPNREKIAEMSVNNRRRLGLPLD